MPPKTADPALEIRVSAAAYYESEFREHVSSLTLPTLEELTQRMNAEPARFVSPSTAEGIRLHDSGGKWRVAGYDHSLIDKREFPTREEAFTYTATLFRKFLHDQFTTFMRMHSHYLAPSEWQYPVDLAERLLSDSLTQAEPRRYVPAVIRPSVEERLHYLEKHVDEAQFLNDGRGDGSHWEKKGSGYIVRSYERGVCYDEYHAANFREALVRTYALGPEPRYALESQSFSRMNYYEFSYTFEG